jgi:hypothetical protein
LFDVPVLSIEELIFPFVIEDAKQGGFGGKPE